MSIHYKRIEMSRGTRYFKDGKMVARDKLKLHVLEALGDKDEFTDNGRYCIFCGNRTNIYRILNLQQVALCKQHYDTESAGRIVQHLRETNEQTPKA